LSAGINEFPIWLPVPFKLQPAQYPQASTVIDKVSALAFLAKNKSKSKNIMLISFFIVIGIREGANPIKD